MRVDAKCKVCGTDNPKAMRRNPDVCVRCNPDQIDSKQFFSNYDTVQNQYFIAKHWKPTTELQANAD